MAGAVPVAEATDEIEAGVWLDALAQAGIPATVFERGLGGALGGAVGWARYPVLVPRSSLGAARNVIAELAGASRLAPFDDPATSRSRQLHALRLVGGIVLVVFIAAVASRLLA